MMVPAFSEFFGASGKTWVLGALAKGCVPVIVITFLHYVSDYSIFQKL